MNVNQLALRPATRQFFGSLRSGSMSTKIYEPSQRTRKVLTLSGEGQNLNFAFETELSSLKGYVDVPVAGTFMQLLNERFDSRIAVEFSLDLFTGQLEGRLNLSHRALGSREITIEPHLIAGSEILMTGTQLTTEGFLLTELLWFAMNGDAEVFVEVANHGWKGSMGPENKLAVFDYEFLFAGEKQPKPEQIFNALLDVVESVNRLEAAMFEGEDTEPGEDVT